MGGGNFSADFYAAEAAVRKSRGVDAFVHHAAMQSVSAEERHVHEKLNPFGVVRESCDSADHPDALAIGVCFDTTGSMADKPRIIHAQLPKLMNFLIEGGVTHDPQILFSAINDAYTSCVAPWQMGQFESDNRMEDDLGRLLFEGGGGGTGEESYEAVLYSFARKTKIDCFDRRGKKGFLFLIGDEKPYPCVSQVQVKRILGDDLQEDIPVADIAAEVRRRYYVFFIVPRGTDGENDPVVKSRWAGLLGAEFVLSAQSEAICETIALAIGLCQGTLTLDQGVQLAGSNGVSKTELKSLRATLSPLAEFMAIGRVESGVVPDEAPQARQ